jgi:hypothetical protein
MAMDARVKPARDERLNNESESGHQPAQKFGPLRIQGDTGLTQAIVLVLFERRARHGPHFLASG